MIKGVADHVDSIRNELMQVVERVEEYLDTALPELRTEVKQLPTQEHRALLVKAMRQEAARSELARSLIPDQQKIRLLRKA